MRVGQAFVFPVLSIINFVIISYSLTPIGGWLKFELYVPLMLVVVLLALLAIGKFMRVKQQTTDLRLVYEQDKENAKNQIIILKALQRSYVQHDPMYVELGKRITYHEEILKN